MVDDERNDRPPDTVANPRVGKGGAAPVTIQEQVDGADVLERPDRSLIQETEDDGALGLTRTSQND